MAGMNPYTGGPGPSVDRRIVVVPTRSAVGRMKYTVIKTDKLNALHEELADAKMEHARYGDTMTVKLCGAEAEILLLKKEFTILDSAAFFLLTNARSVMAGNKVAFYQVEPHAIDHLEEAVERGK